MLRDFRKNRIFNRRALILGTAQSGLATILLGRLGYLQFFKHKEYSIQADSNRIKPIINPAPRGTVFDRLGLPLTKNENSHRLLIYLEKRQNFEKIIDKLGNILALRDAEKENLLKKIKNARRKKIISLIDNIGWDDLARIETHSHKLPGIRIESGIIRKYPFPFETAHFLGYVSSPSENEIDDNQQSLFMHPDFRIGKSGIEKSFDESLRGKYGVKYVEVNVHEIPLRTLSLKEPQEGSHVRLTIDLNLQKFATDRIKDVVASVVVMNVKTGEILAYASSPSFDANKFVEGISLDDWQSLNTDEKKPLNNKPISAIYPPGSTFKPIVALAALEAGIDPDEKINCRGHYRLGNRTFHCWKKHGHGKVNMREAIKHSCNVYFYEVSNRIGHEAFANMARKFGYGTKFNISMGNPSSGLVPSDSWKQKTYKTPWVGGDTLNSAIGQGFVLTTPLQLAVATSRIANGGVAVNPHLIDSKLIGKEYKNLEKEPIIKKEYLDIVREGMNKVMNEKGGTAYWQRIKEVGFEMAGKTGTSQVISKREDQMSKSEIDLNANHALFTGFAPVSDPKYAVSVVVEHGKSGSGAAAPIARDILSKVQGLLVDKIKPS